MLLDHSPQKNGAEGPGASDADSNAKEIIRSRYRALAGGYFDNPRLCLFLNHPAWLARRLGWRLVRRGLVSHGWVAGVAGLIWGAGQWGSDARGGGWPQDRPRPPVERERNRIEDAEKAGWRQGGGNSWRGGDWRRATRRSRRCVIAGGAIPPFLRLRILGSGYLRGKAIHYFLNII